jgi:biotin transport system substrate-specific component
MTTVPVPLARPAAPVLADLLPAARSRAADAGLIATGTVVLVLLSQIVVPLPFTPVPLSLGTLGALLVGAALGPGRGTAAVGLYAVLAALGVPVLAGWAATGVATASFGYTIGYVLAAALLGSAARRGADRSVLRTGLAATAATAAVYVPGVAWLAVATGMDLPAALAAGLLPFLAGDVVKAFLAAVLLPGAWSLVGRAERRARR